MFFVVYHRIEAINSLISGPFWRFHQLTEISARIIAGGTQEGAATVEEWHRARAQDEEALLEGVKALLASAPGGRERDAIAALAARALPNSVLLPRS